MSNLFSFVFKEKEYEVKVNNRVRKALNEFQKRNAKLSLSDDALIELSKIDFSKLDNENATEQEQIKALLPMLKYMNEFNSVSVDGFDVMYVILHTLYGTSNEEFDEIIESLEEQYGSVELCDIVGKINKEAFTIAEKMNNALNQQ